MYIFEINGSNNNNSSNNNNYYQYHYYSMNGHITEYNKTCIRPPTLYDLPFVP